MDCGTALSHAASLAQGETNIDGKGPESGHEAVIKLLLGTGKVDVDARDEYGWTALSWAAESGHEAVLKQLLGTGKVDVDARDDKYGRGPPGTGTGPSTGSSYYAAEANSQTVSTVTGP